MADEKKIADMLNEVFGKENIVVVEVIDIPMPEFEEFDSDDWKILFMLLCENRAHIDFTSHLTEHGKRLLHNVQRKIGINAVGVDFEGK